MKLMLVYFRGLIFMVLIFFFVFYDVQMFYYISFSHSNQWEGIGVWGIIFVKQREIYVLFVKKKKWGACIILL